MHDIFGPIKETKWINEKEFGAIWENKNLKENKLSTSGSMRKF